MADLLFFILAAVMIAGALGVVLSRSLYRAAFCLAATLVASAVVYLALTAPLIAAVQILLYTGGLLTLVVFALVVSGSTDNPQPWRRPVPALVVAVLVGVALMPIAWQVGGTGAGRGGLDDGVELGVLLFTRYLVPFELLSVLLLAAIFGALTVARRERQA